jgi:hypothetical protein
MNIIGERVLAVVRVIVNISNDRRAEEGNQA